MQEIIVALIIATAVEVGVPPYFAVAIATVEHWGGSINPDARVGPNENGSYDLGVMQLNDRYFGHIDWKCPATNIRAGVEHIKWLIQQPELTTYWSVAIAYNCGIARFIEFPPPSASIVYANRVLLVWEQLDKYAHKTIIQR